MERETWKFRGHGAGEEAGGWFAVRFIHLRRRTLMTLEQAFAKFVAVLKTRLQAPMNAGKHVQRKAVDALTIQDLQHHPQMAQDLVDQIDAADPGSPPGVCRYQVGGNPFCLEGLTEAECTGLPGTYDTTTQTCDLPPWPHTGGAPAAQVGSRIDSKAAP
jgi:hypothetical protein